MKRSILVAAIGAAAMVAPTFAADTLTLSGEMDYVFANQKTGATGTSAYNEVLAGGNFKISGDEDLGNGLGGFFFTETGLDADYSAGKAYVGLNTPSAGQFILGHYATATDWVGGTFDSGTFYNNSVKTNAGSKEQGIFWRSPNWGGFQIGLNYLPKQDYTGQSNETKDPGYGIGFVYAASNWGVELGYDTLKNDSKDDSDPAVVRTDPLGDKKYTVLDSWYKFGNYTVALGYGQYKEKDNGTDQKYDSFDYAGLGFIGTWGQHELSLTYGQRYKFKIDGEKPADKPKATNMSLDYAYKLSSRTKIGGGFAQTKDTNNGATTSAVGGGVGVENGSEPGAEDKTSTSIGVGVKHVF